MSGVSLSSTGKMVPVMLGSLLLGGATYSLRQYLSVAAIIAGTVIVSLGNKSKPGQVTLQYGVHLTWTVRLGDAPMHPILPVCSVCG